MTKPCPTCNKPLRRADTHLYEGRRCKAYPKTIPAQRSNGEWFNFHEHRFYCETCKVEWVYSTQDRSFAELPSERASSCLMPLRVYWWIDDETPCTPAQVAQVF